MSARARMFSLIHIQYQGPYYILHNYTPYGIKRGNQSFFLNETEDLKRIEGGKLTHSDNSDKNHLEYPWPNSIIYEFSDSYQKCRARD